MKKHTPIMEPRLGSARSDDVTDLNSAEISARRALAMAMIDLGRAADPAQAFARNKDVIMTSLILLGRGDEAKKLAATYGVTAPLESDSSS
ncbi:MAG: hypothetical protein VX699_06125 [Myxococcota bacterium]|nr:hypothetical protein [Myxococcota bacterium]